MTKVFRVVSLIVVLIAFPLRNGKGNAFTETANATRPNFLIVISDDQRHDTMEFMPRTKARIFDEGITFTNAFATTPLCSPSRASIFTGMYAHNHGVRTNNDILLKKTFVDRLHENGYYTGLVGKYLNTWDGSPRPEFDFWVAHNNGASRYFDPWLNINGSWNLYPGYITYVLRDYALHFLQKAGQQEKPFLLIFAPNAPHATADPAPGDELLYRNLSPHRPPSFNENDVSDKPEWFQYIAPLIESDIAPLDRFRLSQLRCLRSVDQAVDSLLTTLTRQKKLDNTVVVYLSDNGYFWGEHRLRDKTHVYEEAIRTPFALRCPALVQRPRVETKLVANIDIAPTICELAGLSPAPEADGRSLASLLNGNNTWRDDLLIEGWPLPPRFPYAAVHTKSFIYVETAENQAEFYDLANDPFQLDNQASNPVQATAIAAFKKRLKQLQGSNTAVKSFDSSVPEDFSLRQNYPNPFNPTTNIGFQIASFGSVVLKVFDVMGREVIALVDEKLAPGNYEATFDAGTLPGGLYFYRLQAGDFVMAQKMILAK